MPNINKHPITQKIYELCLAIEACGASPELTHAVCLTNDLHAPVDKLIEASTRSALRLEARTCEGTPLPPVDGGEDHIERQIRTAGADVAPRVTPQELEAVIMEETYTVLPSGRVTVCELTLDNGFTVRGESAVVFIENFDAKIGCTVARQNAVNQIWPLLGFRLREKYKPI